MKDTGLINAAGETFAFTISIQNKDQEKIALHFSAPCSRLASQADVRIVDSAQFASLQKTYDYDMIPATWFNSLSPGNEQKFYFGSEGRTTEGTRNYPGLPIQPLMPPSPRCSPPRAARNSPPPCAPSTACWCPASTSFRFMTQVANGWRGGITSVGPIPSRCPDLKPQPCGAIHENA